jgi:SNW domain-containing protein 1
VQGIDAGGGFDDETYAAYDQPWRKQDLMTKNIYRPSKNLDNDIYGSDFDKVINTNRCVIMLMFHAKTYLHCRFVPDKGFAGADPAASGKRDGPVQFEKNVRYFTFFLNIFLRNN